MKEIVQGTSEVSHEAKRQKADALLGVYIRIHGMEKRETRANAVSRADDHLT